jgi:hypothetical protein
VTNRGQTSSNTYTGKDSLIENASYSYYILSETPSYYKELTVNADGSYSFSAMKGAQTKTVAIDATLKTETKYGDYELDLDKETFSSLFDTTTDKIYGVLQTELTMACVIWRISGTEASLPGEPDIQQKFTDALFLLHIINQSWEKPLTALLITQIRE